MLMRENTAPMLAIALGLIAGAFVFGMYVGEARIPELEQVAQVVQWRDGDVVTKQPSVESVDTVDFTPYWRVWNVLERKFIPFSTSTDAQVPLDERLYSSIEGLVKSYNDPYTVFMRPKISKEFKIQTQGSLEGIGSVIGERDGALLIVQPLKDSPAEKAGLRTGDHIQKVDGTETAGMPVEDAVQLIRGQGGTQVVLTIKREGEEVREYVVTRGKIEIPSTTHAVVEREVPKIAVTDTSSDVGADTDTDADDVTKKPAAGSSEQDADSAATEEGETEPVETETRDFYVLRLFSFSKSSVNAFERELRDFIESGSDALIIDLRGNPGGYIDAAVNIAGWFLPDQTVVVREFRGPEHREIVYRTQGRTLFEDTVPQITLLVDGASASASEILAGALQEHGVATVVGAQTFGKGSVQELVEITDELSLKVTVSRWYTPNGVSISKSGLTPDVVVDVENASSSDPFIDAAIDVLTAG